MPEDEKEYQENPKMDIEVVCSIISNLDQDDSVEVIGHTEKHGFSHSLGAVMSTIPGPGRGASVTIRVSSGRLRGKKVTYKAGGIHLLVRY